MATKLQDSWILADVSPDTTGPDKTPPASSVMFSTFDPLTDFSGFPGASAGLDWLSAGLPGSAWHDASGLQISDNPYFDELVSHTPEIGSDPGFRTTAIKSSDDTRDASAERGSETTNSSAAFDHSYSSRNLKAEPDKAGFKAADTFVELEIAGQTPAPPLWQTLRNPPRLAGSIF